MNSYPMRLRPAFKDNLWGGDRLKKDYHKQTDMTPLAESWELSCHKDGSSFIENGPYAGMSLADYVKTFPEAAGTRAQAFPAFPILFKLIDAKDNLSVQVHPDDAYALRVEGEYGKTEMWVVLDCQPGAKLVYGFRKPVTKEEFRAHIQENTLMELVNEVEVHKGDVFFIQSGTLHAIGKGIVIAEIQQNSDTTFRVYDYNRLGADGKPRQLHLERAAEVMNYAPMYRAADTLPPCPPDGVQEVLTCEYFRVRRAEVETRIPLATDGESFTHLMCVRGEGNIVCGGKVYPFRQGDSYFLPAALGEYAVEGDGSLVLSGV